jgi:glycosyltransferase EpsE
MKPRITVIMATYNDEAFISECLKSLTNQTFKDFLVKIIDDNSSDKTVDIIEEWCQKDSRVTLVGKNDNNMGLTKNLNKLIALVDTEFIARMDGDDICLPTRFEKQMDFLKANPEYSVVGTCAFDIDEYGNVIKDRLFPETNNQVRKAISKYNPVLHPSVIIKTQDLKDLKGYDEAFRFVQDYDLWFRFLSNNKKIYNMKDQLLKYRVITTHHKKRNFKYRMIDAKIRWRGTRALNESIFNRILSVLIPFTLGIMPVFMKRYLVRYSHGK